MSTGRPGISCACELNLPLPGWFGPSFQADWGNALSTSTTIYVGNLAFTTREEQLYDVFGRVGHIKRIVMGLDKVQKTPCGFAFAIYYTRKVRGIGISNAVYMCIVASYWAFRLLGA
ncbi:hypothetical protein Vafri_2972 [Volvox africanus]|uniref:Nuclear cap-binding protein subunit 2 n=1 Tax=Volvox africanus TaxID=51714 RepID=A0A8J4AQJ5_9CHLO|nr:hypothetical protein Vafri_2972 [Volvox africanus]